MAIDIDKLMRFQIPDREQSYSHRDTMLYALGVGLGMDNTDLDQVRFVYEEDLEALPTMAVVLAHPGFWLRDEKSGVDWIRAVHGEQGLKLVRPIPPSGRVAGVNRLVDVIDKGPGRGVIILSERKVFDVSTGDLLAEVTQSTFCRGEGGLGLPVREQAPQMDIPARAPDLKCSFATSPQAAQIYRLSGDVNPLHVNPKVAEKAGYPRPILHGLSGFGVAGHALLKMLCGYRPAALGSINCRFVAPVYPGDTLATEVWRQDGPYLFRVRAVERDVVVMSNGAANLADGFEPEALSSRTGIENAL